MNYSVYQSDVLRVGCLYSELTAVVMDCALDLTRLHNSKVRTPPVSSKAILRMDMGLCTGTTLLGPTKSQSRIHVFLAPYLGLFGRVAPIWGVHPAPAVEVHGIQIFKAP